jgi:hypothetical protein
MDAWSEWTCDAACDGTAATAAGQATRGRTILLEVFNCHTNTACGMRCLRQLITRPLPGVHSQAANNGQACGPVHETRGCNRTDCVVVVIPTTTIINTPTKTNRPHKPTPVRASRLLLI